MDEDLHTLIRTSKIFSSLPHRALKKLLSKFIKVELDRGDILFHQGDPSDSIEILLEGKLSAVLTTATGENKIIGYIEPGETVGEIGTLSGEPRTTTIKAVKDSVLFKLPSEIFVDLCHQYPSVLFEIINPIVSRSQQVIQIISSEKFKKNVVIAPANEEVSLQEFSKNLGQLLEGLPTIIFLSDFDDRFKEQTEGDIQAWIDQAKEKNTKKHKQKIIYLIKNNDSVLAKYCYKHLDMLYIVGDEKSPILLDDGIIAKLTEFKAKTHGNPELILLHYQQKKLPRNTTSWLHLTDFGLHHHVRLEQAKDFRRLLRFIRGKAVGLVLSGGGTRGWGHIGAIKALEEAGIPIDAVGGTSVGAIIAASYAIKESYEGTLSDFKEVIEGSRNSVSWRSLTWPAISLFNAKGLTQILHKVYDEIQIENLWLPYFCVSTNLANNSECVHQRGTLWEKIRSSVSIPGVIPPMLLEGELHFDGGLLNNLPVDIMRKIVSHRGNVIAIELASNNKDEHIYNFPPVLTFWQTLFAKLKFKVDYSFPPFIDTFLKSLLVGSSLKAQVNGLAADILVPLDLSKYPMLHSNKHQEHKIIEEGYDATLHQIKNMKRVRSVT